MTTASVTSSYSLVRILAKGLQSLYLFEQYANHTLLDVLALE